MIPRPSLTAIVAHARSGSLDHAWKLFREAGFDTADDDAAVLAVRARLLKDKALASTGPARREAFLAAAAAYGRAAELQGDIYPLINAATLSRLAGQADSASRLARQVLDRIQSGQDHAETPYWRAATQAEALLLLDRIDEARALLAAGIASAPRAWEDHASTLRQFALILAELGEDDTWLDACRPPRALHFAGHMGLAGDGGELRLALQDFLTRERIGFGFGALAAGADIVIAEALLKHGAQLHLILPAGVEDFREASVDRYGLDWAIRFDQVLHQAESLRELSPSVATTHPLAIRLAAEIAMGGAVMKAATFMTEAVQLLVLDRAEPEPTDTGASAWIKAAWSRGGRRQQVIVAPREQGPPPGAANPETAAADWGLSALLCIDLGSNPLAVDAELDRLVGEILPGVRAALSEGGARPIASSQWTPAGLILAFPKPAEAVAAGRRLLTALAGLAPVRIGGHYGLVRFAPDPLDGRTLVLGDATGLPGQVAASAPVGAFHVTEDFAAALHADLGGQVVRSEYVDDLPPADIEDEMRLFTIKT